MLATKVIAKKFRTEFVLVSNPDEKDEDHNDKTLKRSIFIQNLQKRGLKVKTKRDSNLVFDLIYAPKQVLERYAEILKIKMPLKASYCDAVRLSEAEDDENFKLFEKQAKEKSLRDDFKKRVNLGSLSLFQSTPSPYHKRDILIREIF